MESTASCEITAWLRACSQGDEGAPEHLIPLVGRELRRFARHYLGSVRPDPIQVRRLGHEGSKAER